jgi:hypothetical protein
VSGGEIYLNSHRHAEEERGEGTWYLFYSRPIIKWPLSALRFRQGMARRVTNAASDKLGAASTHGTWP